MQHVDCRSTVSPRSPLILFDRRDSASTFDTLPVDSTTATSNVAPFHFHANTSASDAAAAAAIVDDDAVDAAAAAAAT